MTTKLSAITPIDEEKQEKSVMNDKLSSPGELITDVKPLKKASEDVKETINLDQQQLNADKVGKKLIENKLTTFSRKRIRVNFKYTKLSQKQNDIVQDALEFTNFKYKYKMIKDDERSMQKKAKVKNKGNHFDIIVSLTSEYYQIPQFVLDEHYESILKSFNKKSNIKQKIRKKLKIVQIEIVDYDYTSPPDEEMTMKEFKDQYKNYFSIKVNAVVSQIETFLFALKSKTISLKFGTNTTMVMSAFILSCLDKDNYDNSKDDNIISIEFEINFGLYSYRGLKRFFKLIQTGNIIFENINFLKIKLNKSPELKLAMEREKLRKQELKKIEQEQRNKQDSKSRIDSQNTLQDILDFANNKGDDNRRPSFLPPQKNKGKGDDRRTSIMPPSSDHGRRPSAMPAQISGLAFKEEQDEQMVSEFNDCKVMVRKIYRSLCTQNLIDHFQKSQKEKFKELKKQKDHVKEYVEIMHDISYKHQILCQNQKVYDEIQRKQLKKLYSASNILPNFEEFNMVSVFTIKNTRSFVEPIIDSTWEFFVEFIKISSMIGFCWTFIGVLIPLRVLKQDVKKINAYFNVAGNIKHIGQFMPQIFQNMFQLGFVQIYQAGSLFLVIYNHIDLHTNGKNPSISTESLLIIYIFYWVYYVFIQTIFEMTRMVSKYYDMINAFTEDMYDINEFQISQKSNYLEFLEDIEDSYMKNIIPVIPSRYETIKKLGFVIGENLRKGQFFKSHPKKWISAQMLVTRYIYEKQPIVSKDPDNLIEELYKFPRRTYWVEQKEKLKIYFLVLIRAAVIPSLIHVFGEGFETDLTLVMVVVFSLLVYILTIVPSAIEIFDSQNSKHQQIKRIINLITQREVKDSPREVSLINIFCITSIETWHNMARITYGRSRRPNVIRDVQVTIHGLIGIIMLLVLVSDIFGLFWEKRSLFDDYKFIVMYVLDLMVLFFVIFRSLWFKVQHNFTYDVILLELEKIISLITDISRSLQEQIYLFEKDRNLDEEEAVGLIGGTAIQDTLIKIGMYQIERNAKIRAFLHTNKETLTDEELKSATEHYSIDLLKKYEQIKKEIEYESVKKAAMFLGLLKVDDKLIKQIVIASFIAIGSSSANLITSWIQEKNNS